MNTPRATAMKGPHHSFVVRDVVALKPSHSRVRALREQGLNPSEFGSRIWRSSYLLIDYLARQTFTASEHVLELGCGWGLPSQFLQKTFGLRVTATDVDPRVRHYLDLLSEYNDTDIGFDRCGFADLRGPRLHGVDTLVGADICYKRSNGRDLGDLVDRFFSGGGRRVILADSGRDSFFGLAERLDRKWTTSLRPLSLSLPAEASGHILHLGSH